MQNDAECLLKLQSNAEHISPNYCSSAPFLACFILVIVAIAVVAILVIAIVIAAIAVVAIVVIAILVVATVVVAIADIAVVFLGLILSRGWSRGYTRLVSQANFTSNAIGRRNPDFSNFSVCAKIDLSDNKDSGKGSLKLSAQI